MEYKIWGEGGVLRRPSSQGPVFLKQHSYMSVLPSPYFTAEACPSSFPSFCTHPPPLRNPDLELKCRLMLPWRELEQSRERKGAHTPLPQAQRLSLIYWEHIWAWSSSQRDAEPVKGLACLQPYKIFTSLNNTINTTHLAPRIALKIAVRARSIVW